MWKPSRNAPALVWQQKTVRLVRDRNTRRDGEDGAPQRPKVLGDLSRFSGEDWWARKCGSGVRGSTKAARAAAEDRPAAVPPRVKFEAVDCLSLRMPCETECSKAFQGINRTILFRRAVVQQKEAN